MLFIFIAAATFDIFTWGSYNYTWNKFCEEQTEAQKAGFENTYFICNRAENVRLDGTDYVHFHAYRSAFLDGAYQEELLMPSNLTYLDKAPAQNSNLVLFAKEISYYDDNQGKSYTIVKIYSVCDYSLTGSENLIDIAVIATIIAGFAEIIMVLIFVIHLFSS